MHVYDDLNGAFAQTERNATSSSCFSSIKGSWGHLVLTEERKGKCFHYFASMMT